MAFRSNMKKAAAGLILVGGLAVAGPAVAQTATYVGVDPPAVGGVDAAAGSRPAAVLASQSQTLGAVQGNAGGLAFTGADIIGLSTMGLGAIGIGAIAVRSGRRRAAAGGDATS